MAITVAEAKQKAERVQERLVGMGYPVTHAQALEVVACTFGDASWGAMRKRLKSAKASVERDEAQPEKRRRLQVFYNLALYAQLHDGSREFIAKRCVICYTVEQAREFLYEKCFPGQYESSGYGHPVYERDGQNRGCELSSADMPRVADVCEWLSDILTSPHTADRVVEDFWALMEKRGSRLARSRPEPTPTVLWTVLEEATPDFWGVSELFDELYRVLPENSWYSHELEESFGYDNNELDFRVG
jgi:hypothetical protein